MTRGEGAGSTPGAVEADPGSGPPNRPAAVLAGASGLVGGQLREALVQARAPDGGSAYREVVLLTRRPLGLEQPAAAGADGGSARPAVRELLVDFDDLVELGRILAASLRDHGQYLVNAERDDLLRPLRRSLVGGHLFCALGTTIRKAGSRAAFRRVDHDYPLALGRIAKACGTTFVGLVSSIGADPGARSFYLRVKGEVEDGLRGLGLPSLALLRPSVIGGERRESRPLETLSKWVLAVVPGRYRTVHAGDIARALVTVGLERQPGTRVLESEEIRKMAASDPA